MKPPQTSVYSKYSVLAIFLWCVIPLYAQQYQFSHLTVNDGLTQSSVYGIHQDKQGFMWFGSSDGLNRYDGISIKTYKHKPIEKLRGTGNFYGKNCVEDKAGNLYWSGRTGMVFYNRTQDAVNRFYPVNDTAKFDNFMHVLALRGDTLWFTDCNRYFYAYHLTTKKISRVEAKTKFNKPEFFHAEMDQQGRIWFSTLKGIGCYDIYTKTYTYHLQELFGKYGLILFTDALVVGQNKLILTAYMFAVEYDIANKTYKELLPSSKAESYYRIWVDANKQVYIGSMSSGLWIIGKDGVQHIVHHPNEEQVLGSNIVVSMCMDRSGNLWMGCDGFGVSKMNTHPSNFNLYRKNFKQGYQFTTNFIKCFYANTSTIWFGTHEGGLHELNRATQTCKVHKFKWTGANTIACIYALNNNTFLLGTGAGILEFNTQTGVAKKLLTQPTVLALHGQNFIQSIVKTSATKFWVSTRSGMYSFTYSDGRFSTIVKDSLRSSAYLVSLCKTKNGVLWAGDMEYGHVYKFKETATGKLALVDTILKGNVIRCFYEDTLNNTLWMASEKGLIKYNLKTGLHKLITEKEGLVDHYLYAVLPGIGNELWLSSNHGLMSYNKATEKVKAYSVSDGLQSNEFNTGCYYRAPDGELFFGGIEGFNSFYPSQITTNKNTPMVVLNTLLVNDESFKQAGNPAVLKELNLVYNQNTLSFDFSALEFTNSSKNQYQYMLAQVDKNWVDAGQHHFARYTSLAPGYYQLWVKACNNDNMWSEPKQLLAITISAPWWMRWWFIVIEVTLAFALAFFVIRYFTTRKLKEKIRQMEAVNQERTRIAKDMHDDLGSGISKIAIMTQLLKNKKLVDADAQKQIDKIEHTAHELVDNMGQIVWTMNASNDTLENFLAYVREYAYDFFEGTSVLATISFTDPESNLFMPQYVRRNLFLVIKETLNNTIKHAQAKEVILNFSVANDVAKLEICDDGIGFDTTSTRRFGNGLSNMAKRLNEVQATYKINSVIGAGTQTIITWKIANT